MRKTKNETISKKQLREFGLITGCLLALILGLFLPWRFDFTTPDYFWVIVAGLLIWAIIHPVSLKPVYKVWMLIGNGIGWVNTRIILGLVFYSVIFPIGVVLRVLGKDPLGRKLNSSISSYRVNSDNRSKEHMERPF